MCDFYLPFGYSLIFFITLEFVMCFNNKKKIRVCGKERKNIAIKTFSWLSH
jgi:hypothetical protein